MKNSRVAVIILIVLAVVLVVFAAVVPAVAPSQPTVVAQSDPTEIPATEAAPGSSEPTQNAPAETSSSAPSSDGSRKEVIHRLEEAFNQGDRDAVAELFSPDFVGHMPENDLFGSTFDVNAMIDLVSILPAALPDLHVESDMLIAEGDLVAQRALINGTFEVEFFGFPPTGNPIAFAANVFYRFDDSGLIVEQWIEFDTQAVLPQFDEEAES
jgi:predicted ester cyclase